MLHVIYLDEGERPACGLSNLVYYGEVADIRQKFCNRLENYYYFEEENDLRSEMPARFLKERYGVEWFDDWVITFPGRDGKGRELATPSCLSTAVQMAADMIVLSVFECRGVVCSKFVPRFEDLVWISTNCKDLTVYLEHGRTLYLDKKNDREMQLAKEKKLIDFCFREKHVNCSCVEFLKMIDK
jgi:hypothetical protein